MPKPHPELLAPARYPFHCRTEPRFGDLDVNLHINNVAMATILEDGRVRFHRASGYRDALAGLTSMVASITIEYLGQGAYPATIDMYVAIDAIGRTSHTLVQLVMQGGQVLAFARTVLVTVGPDGPAPLPPSFVDTAAPWRFTA